MIALYAADDVGEPLAAPARRALASFLEENGADYGGPLRSQVRQGEAVAEILAAGEREQPDLVLLGITGAPAGSDCASAAWPKRSSATLRSRSWWCRRRALGSAFAEAIGVGTRCSVKEITMRNPDSW